MPATGAFSKLSSLFSRKNADICSACYKKLKWFSESEEVGTNDTKLAFAPKCAVCAFFKAAVRGLDKKNLEQIRDANSWSTETDFTAAAVRKPWGARADKIFGTDFHERYFPDLGYIEISWRHGHKDGSRINCALVRVGRTEDQVTVNRATDSSLIESVYPLPTVHEWLWASAAHDHSRYTIHGQAGKHDLSRHSRSFHLIDCQDQCVVKMGDDTAYAALSYVWGNTRQIMLTKANCNRMLQRNSLDIVLPKTIRDAMSVCTALNIRYLWVDALCIIQNDEQDKMTNINNMDMVYQRAVLTIVAATGEHADSGLPMYHYGFSNHGNYVSAHGVFLQEWKDQWGSGREQRPKWSTRGWTYQEAMLSTKILLFSRDTIYCICPCQTLMFDPLTSRCHDTNSGSELIPTFTSSTTGEEPGHFYQIYTSAIAEYLTRSLTSSGDSLNAMKGILSRLESGIGPFQYGLPLQTHPSSLLWSLDDAVALSRITHSPSWSWAGWSATMGMGRLRSDDLYMAYVSVQLFALSEAGLSPITVGVSTKLQLHLQRTIQSQAFRAKTTEFGNLLQQLCPTSAEMSSSADLGARTKIPHDHIIVFGAWEVQMDITHAYNNVYSVHGSLDGQMSRSVIIWWFNLSKKLWSMDTDSFYVEVLVTYILKISGAISLKRSTLLLVSVLASLSLRIPLRLGYKV